VRFDGRNLGLDSRQLRFEVNRQGNWGYFAEYGRIPRVGQYTAISAVSGIGSSTLSVPATPTAGVPFDLKTRRDVLGLGFDKILWGSWEFNVRFRNEEKDGARTFARGTPGAFEFTPEPINSTTRQLDVLLNYTGEKLQLSGGLLRHDVQQSLQPAGHRRGQSGAGGTAGRRFHAARAAAG
jgi:hypothetical protein